VRDGFGSRCYRSVTSGAEATTRAVRAERRRPDTHHTAPAWHRCPNHVAGASYGLVMLDPTHTIAIEFCVP
jgi:hypothetical protein